MALNSPERRAVGGEVPRLAGAFEVGVNAELPKLIKAMADRSIADGHGGEQYPVLIEEFGKPRGD
ncbi:hypothetical protein CGZ69_01785 [Streptomyces peucetius subsp. caesius ATCC 27952]|nr:hypothetical protein CGZ69_01785 [Streptomyces peucetius subsp. caesius ATCC 27952]